MENKATREQIKRVKRFHEHRERDNEGVFLVEGIRLMEEAIRARIKFREVFYTAEAAEKDRCQPILSSLRNLHLPLFKVSEQEMKAMAETETPQGILAVAIRKKITLGEILHPKGLVVAVCALQDPGNLGTILRTADAGEAAGVITTSDTVDLYNPKVIRAAMGSLFRLPAVRVSDMRETLKEMKESGYRVVAASGQSKTSYLDIHYPERSVLLIGRESSGLPDDLLKMADEKVFIPMRAGVESLNAAISTAILIYEARRQRRA